MKISGLQKLSLVDYEGHVSATIFTSGCNFACPFCHNSGLVKNTEPAIPEEEIVEYLTKRKNMLDGVCISGGEPTLHLDLPKFITKIKSLGYPIKLDTNGTNLEMLKYLVENKLIDYIAMDIKNSYAKYSATTNKEINTDTIKNTIDYIMNCGIDYEFRTTLVREFHNLDDIKEIAKMIKNAKAYYLQRFEDSGACMQSNLHDIPKAEVSEFLNYLIKYIPNTHLRGY